MSIASRVPPMRVGGPAAAVQLATRIAPESRAKLEQIAIAENITIRHLIESAIDRRWDELQTEVQSA